MSASIVRKALELDLDEQQSVDFIKSKKDKQLKNKFILNKQKKKAQSGDKILKQNLKILKALGSLSSHYSSTRQGSTNTSKSTPPVPQRTPPPSSEDSASAKKSKKKSKKSSKESSAFTEDDFTKFESEYFVTD